MNYQQRHRARVVNATLQDALAQSPWDARDVPDFSLDRQIVEARKSMGEARWAELNREWK